MKHVFPADLVEVGSRQWIFDKVVAHYRAQPWRCADERGPRYRYNGHRCFASALIDDEHYDKSMERHGASELMRFALPTWFKDNLEFITALQCIHDRKNWGAMDEVLMTFAAEHGLEMPL